MDIAGKLVVHFGHVSAVEEQARAVRVGILHRIDVEVLIHGIAAIMTAAATPIIGPLTFVGLMAPHIVLVIGIRKVLPALLSTAVAGATVMVVADWLARTIAFPLQLPTGLVAAMVGAPFLMLLLSRHGASHAA